MVRVISVSSCPTEGTGVRIGDRTVSGQGPARQGNVTHLLYDFLRETIMGDACCKQASAVSTSDVTLLVRATDPNSTANEAEPPYSAAPPAVADPIDLERYTERYTEPGSIWEALLAGNVRLVRASWLVKHSRAGGILMRRQDVPEEAFVGIEELKRCFGAGNKDNVLPVLAISL
jgi:hypothetical protein